MTASNPAIPDRTPNASLARGLTLLRFLTTAGQNESILRYRDLKSVLPGITDATLSRLLSDLETLGYVEKDGTSGYRPGKMLHAWMRDINRHPEALRDRMRTAVNRLIDETGESAALASLHGDRILIEYSKTAACEGSVRIIETGATLHFEPDHAGALAILESLDPDQQHTLIRGPRSRFQSGDTLAKAAAAFRREGSLWWDSSRIRPGICRIALPLRFNDWHGCLFLCLTQVQAETCSEHLLTALKRARDSITSTDLSSKRSQVSPTAPASDSL